jgi:hypothetical protein
MKTMKINSKVKVMQIYLTYFLTFLKIYLIEIFAYSLMAYKTVEPNNETEVTYDITTD